MSEPDLTAMIAALETARVVDFMRFVSRQMASDQRLREMPFRDGWNIMIGRYAQLASEPAS